MADKAATLLKDLVTDPNQQVHCTILSAKVIEGDLFDVKVEFSDGNKGEGEMFSPGGRVPKKDESFKLTLENRTAVPTEVPVKDKDGNDTDKMEIVEQDRAVVCGYPM